MQNEIRQIKESIANETLGTTIERLSAFVVQNNVQGVLPRIKQVADNYSLMQHFFIEGFSDPQRAELLGKMKADLYYVCLDIINYLLITTNHTLKILYDETLKLESDFLVLGNELFELDRQISIALLDVSQGEKLKELYRRQYELRKTIFNKILVMPRLNSAQFDALQQLLASPTTDSANRQIIIGALALAQQCCWDERRFLLLCSAYAEALGDHAAREQALIGIVAALPSPGDLFFTGKSVRTTFADLFSSSDARKRLTEIQCQMLISMDTEKTDRTIEQEIMPTLKSHAEKLQREIDGQDATDISNILNPNAEEEATEEIEGVINRMRKMKQKGMDVFFGGFARTKRFPFFYTLMNWFCPFYLQHPGLSAANADMLRKINRLVEIQAMCNSDKYSFILSVQSIINNMPSALRTLLDGDLPVPENIHSATSPMEVSQLLLQDWYRFYNLYPFKADFRNHLADEVDVCFFSHPLVVELMANQPDLIASVAQQLFKRERLTALRQLLAAYDLQNHPELQPYEGYILLKNMDFEKAYSVLSYCLGTQPDNRLLYQRTAEAAFLSKNFAAAEFLYAEMLNRANWLKYPDEVNYLLALCLLHQKRADKALPTLFRLNYEHDDQRFSCALAVALLQQGKAGEAVTKLSAIPTPPSRDTLLTKGIALFANGRMKESVECLRNFANQYPEQKATLLIQLREKAEFASMPEEKSVELAILFDAISPHL